MNILTVNLLLSTLVFAIAARLTRRPVALRVSSNAEADTNPGAPPLDIVMPARTILVAAGTQPNTVLAREEGVSLALDGKYFQACDEAGQPLKPEPHAAKPLHPDVLLHRRDDGRFMSFFGDLHPSYFGNVVKAMGSAKQGYPVVSRVVSIKEPSSSLDDAAFLTKLNRDLRAVVHEVRRLTPRIMQAPLSGSIRICGTLARKPEKANTLTLPDGRIVSGASAGDGGPGDRQNP